MTFSQSQSQWIISSLRFFGLNPFHLIMDSLLTRVSSAFSLCIYTWWLLNNVRTDINWHHTPRSSVTRCQDLCCNHCINHSPCCMYLFSIGYTGALNFITPDRVNSTQFHPNATSVLFGTYFPRGWLRIALTSPPLRCPLSPFFPLLRFN